MSYSRISSTVVGLTRADLVALAGLQDLDRFLQWDLITITPFGTPAIAAVGARFLPEKGEIWTSTTVGYGLKVRNIRLHPRVALLRAAPGVPAILLRGEASVGTGDGTTNLTRLFELMGGAGGQRAFFGETATNPFWRGLYREYWRRVLIKVRITEVCQLGASGWRVQRLRVWKPWRPEPAPQPPQAGPSRRGSGATGALDLRGRELLTDGLPAMVAVVDERLQAPMAFPVEARPSSDGSIQVRLPPGQPPSRSQKTSLAVRVIDDSFEIARMVGWIGTLEKGFGWREFRPRSAYGFGKPPGVVPDIAAGLAAALMNVRSSDGASVSAPQLARAASAGSGPRAEQLRLPPSSWTLLERLFLSCAAAAPWHAAMASMATDPALRVEEMYLAQRTELERDWAHAILLRGRRRVSAATLSRAALAALPRSVDPRVEWRRQELLRERWRSELRSTLPPTLERGLLPALGDLASAGGVLSRRSSVVGAAATLASSAAATLDRLLPLRRG
jgi:hypothetical protein